MKKNYLRNSLTLLLAMLFVGVGYASDVITVCAQNVQNFFYTLDRGRTQGNWVTLSNYTTAEGRQAKADAIVNNLAPYQADIYAFNEVEARPEGSDIEALDLLANGMSAKTGITYKVVYDGMTYNLDEDATGTIKSGFIYRTDRIAPVGDNVSTAIGYTIAYPHMMRMQTFKSLASGEEFTISMNHFKASTSATMSDDIVKREQNSIALLKGLTAATDPDILVLGDLNSEMGEQCLKNLTDAGFEEQILKMQGNNTYSYYFNDDGMLIDHVFANSTMAKQITDAKVLYIANPHSTGSRYTAYSDHDPYLVTLSLQAQPAATYSYAKTNSITTDVPYLMVAPINGLQAAKPVDINKTYEYQLTTDVTETDGVITMNDPRSAIIFEDAGEGKYYIKDYYGRYVYQYYYTNTSKYSNSTNVGIKSAAHPFTATLQDDGTFKVLNTVSNCYYIGLTYYSTPEFALYDYASLSSTQHLPWLYQYDATLTPTAITTLDTDEHRSEARKVMIQGQLVIIMPDGKRYNLQGIELK